jgi:hypothetical protein
MNYYHYWQLAFAFMYIHSAQLAHACIQEAVFNSSTEYTDPMY